MEKALKSNQKIVYLQRRLQTRRSDVHQLTHHNIRRNRSKNRRNGENRVDSRYEFEITSQIFFYFFFLVKNRINSEIRTL